MNLTKSRAIVVVWLAVVCLMAGLTWSCQQDLPPPLDAPSINNPTTANTSPPRQFSITNPCAVPFKTWGHDFGGFLHWTPDGERLLVDDDDVITLVDETGRKVRSVVDANRRGTGLGIHGFYADLSPDGSRIAYSSCEGYYELAVVGIDGTKKVFLTAHSGLDHYPAWSPDGSQIMYIGSGAPSLVDGNATYAIIDTESRDIRYTNTRATLYPPVWSPNGKQVAMVVLSTLNESGYGNVLATFPVDETGAEQIGTDLTKIDLITALPVWTPDGREVVYASWDGTVPVVYAVQPDGGGKRTLWRGSEGSSAVPVTHLHLSPDGSRLLIVADGITVIDKDGGNARQIVAPRLGIVTSRLSEGALAKWSPDGSRIAVYQRQFFADEGRRVLLTAHLFTVASDGLDLRLLAVKKGAMSPLAAASPAGPAGEAADAAACSAGVVVPDPEENPDLVQDCEVLLGMQQALTGPTRADVGDGGGAQPRPLLWDAERPIDQWEGISVGCSPRRVIGIALPGRELAGTVPPELGRLSEMRTIDFGNPDEFYLRDSLAVTRVFTEFPNLLTGTLPKELADLPHLRALKLRNNYLSGPFPEELRGLEGLTTLELDGNNILDAEPDRTPDVSGGVAGQVIHC